MPNDTVRLSGGSVDPVEEIKARLSIEDVVGRYVDLKRSGASYKGLCPFHQEKTPSFYVSPSRGTYHCFGCGKGGDVFSFVMETERLPFPDALRRLADQAGVTLPEREPQKPSLKGRLYEVNAAAARFFHEMLGDPRAARARDYLKQRGFGQEAIQLFELGYAPEGREALVSHLHQAGFDDRILLAAGLVLQDDIGGKTRDRFRGRLMFPIRDPGGRVTGFGGRTLGDAQPKYLNSPQTEIFDKSGVLFGIHRAQDAIRQAGKAVLVEGYLDAVRAHLGGYLYTVASLGTAVTTQQLASLARFTETIILALDPDVAGQSAAARTALTALAEVTRAKGRGAGAAAAVDLRIARLPDGHGDPDELIRDHPDLWEQALATAVPAFEFYFTQTVDSLDRSSDGWRQAAIDKLLPVIQQFTASAGWQAVWLERLASETGIDVQALQRAIPGAAPSRRTRAAPPRPEVPRAVTSTSTRAMVADPIASVEEKLMALLLQLVVLPTDAVDLLADANLGDPAHRVILDHLLQWQRSGNYDYELFRQILPADVVERADALRKVETPLPDDGKISVAVAYHLARLRQFRLQSQHRRVSDLLKEVGPDDRPVLLADVARLNNERRELDQVLDRLSQLVVQSPTVSGP